MLIIRGNDYYDGCGYGVDKAYVFTRTNEFFKDIKLPFALPLSMYGYVPNLSYQYLTKSIFGKHLTTEIFNVKFGYVTVATKCYPFIKTHHDYHYSMDAKLTKILYKFKRDQFPTVEQFFAIPRETYKDYLISRRIVTSFSILNNRDKWEQTINCDGLVDKGFASILDAFSCHQEIFQYVSGVIANNPDIIVLSDKDKIRKAGFDTVTSFRKGIRADEH